MLIDYNENPIKNIKIIKPDYFAKGFEYNNLKANPKTNKYQTLNEYGGKIIFTPGDVVYSSTKLLINNYRIFHMKN